METAHRVAELLGLIAHPEGGYFRETYRSGATPMQSRGATDLSGDTLVAFEAQRRNVMTSIYWMPTRESPIGWLCSNRSPHVHYYHAGSALTYYVIAPTGELSKYRLGPDLAAGERPQLVVPGGYWKAAELESGEYCLLGEAVAPGFDSSDFEFVTLERLLGAHPEHSSLQRFLRPAEPDAWAAYYPEK